MTDANAQLLEKMAALKATYASKLKGRVDEIDAVLRALTEAPSIDEERQAAQNLQALTHKLSGTGTTYGFPNISEASKAIELFCGSILKDQVALSQDQRDHFADLIVHLSAAVPPSDT